MATGSEPKHIKEDAKYENASKSTAFADSYEVKYQDNDPGQPWKEVAATVEETGLLQEAFITHTMQQATYQTKQKFGERIEAKRGNEFRTVILPKIEEAMERLSTQMDEGTLRNLRISKQPTLGKSEKIFHIQDASTKNDVFRFHVRREHPPGQGYWFTFHYHVESDQFENHHELGSIYWDRNTPPNWVH